MTQTIAASGIRPGHKIKQIQGEDVTNRRLVVTEVKRGQYGPVTILGTSRNGAEKVLYTNVNPQSKVTVS